MEALVIILVLHVPFFAEAYRLEWNGLNGVVSYV